MKPEDVERIKDLLPTDLGSGEIRGKIAADILRRSVFSARMASASYLAKIREGAAKLQNETPEMEKELVYMKDEFHSKIITRNAA